jgi:hypothetical protein
MRKRPLPPLGLTDEQTKIKNEIERKKKNTEKLTPLEESFDRPFSGPTPDEQAGAKNPFRKR